MEMFLINHLQYGLQASSTPWRQDLLILIDQTHLFANFLPL